ncbi:MAG: DUF2125 domain-containing protein [Magnetospiraceae bacterium]
MKQPQPTPAPKAASKKALGAILFVVLLAGCGLGGYWIYWNHTAGIFRQSVDIWFAEQRARGHLAGYDSLEVSGFPMRIDARLRGATLVDGGGRWGWIPPEITGTARPWTPLDITANAPGTHRFTIKEGERRLDLVGEVDIFTLQFVSHFGKGLQQVTGLVNKLEVRTTGGAVLASARRMAGAITRLETDKPPGASPPFARFSGEAIDLVLPPGLDLPFGPEVKRIAARGKILGEIPPSPTARQLRAWRSVGGSIALEKLDVQYGAVTVDARGNLALDTDLQPQAALTAEIEGFEAILAALQERGALKPQEAAMAQVFLGALAKEQPDGRKTVRVPIALNQGVLSAGPMKLLRLPPLQWRGAGAPRIQSGPTDLAPVQKTALPPAD